MKVPFRKPAPDTRKGMEVIPHIHTLRTEEAKDGTGKVTHTYQTVTLAYPEGHPMRVYRDKKKALKEGKKWSR